MKKIILLSLTLFSFGSIAAQPPSGDAQKGEVYGNFNDTQKGSILNLNHIKENETMEGSFKGIVQEVCAKKGCWIQLQLSDGKKATVKMKDYSFFVPTALENKEVLIQGKAELKIVSVAELQHLAEDANKTQEEINAITEPQKTISILANGIQVIK